MNRPLHSITLYALSDRYNRKEQTFEEVLQIARDAGGQGLEIVAPQMTVGHPCPSDAWIAYFKDCCVKYELDPVCYSVYLDTGKTASWVLSEGERMIDTIIAMEYAKKMGFSVTRTHYPLTPATMEKLLPYAEELDMHLAIELHGPCTPSTPVFVEYAELFERKQSEHLGIVMDFSSFASGAPSNVLKRIPEGICNKPLLKEIVDYHIKCNTQGKEGRKG